MNHSCNPRVQIEQAKNFRKPEAGCPTLNLNLKLRMRMMQCCVFFVNAAYGCKSWTLNSITEKRIGAFECI